MSKVLEGRLERIKMAIDKGYTANVETGEVFGASGNLITGKNIYGYRVLQFLYNGKHINIRAHQFIWYLATAEVVDCIDHINGIKTDNRISNLRNVTKQENGFNTKAKGYSWNKATSKWKAQIWIGSKNIHLGLFIQEEDAKQAYLNAKEKYHSIQ